MSKQMNINYRLFFAAFLVAALFIASSCKTREWVPPPQTQVSTHNLNYQFVGDNLLKYNRFSADFSADYSSNGIVTSFSGQIRMLRDSFIWVSASAVMGIEVSRILVTPDSFMIIDRVHNTYMCTGFSYLKKQTHPLINIGILQELLTGNDIPGYDTKDFNAKCVNGNCDMVCTDRKNLADSTVALYSKISFSKQSGKILAHHISANNPKAEINMQYFDHEPVSGQLVPATVKAGVTGENQKFLTLTYKNIKINVVQKAPFRIPERFTKMK